MSVIKVASWLFLAGMAPMIIKYKHVRRAKRRMQSVAFTCPKFIGQNSLEFATQGMRTVNKKRDVASKKSRSRR